MGKETVEQRFFHLEIPDVGSYLQLEFILNTEMMIYLYKDEAGRLVEHLNKCFVKPATGGKIQLPGLEARQPVKLSFNI